MNREIKFRAWDSDGKHIIVDSPIRYQNGERLDKNYTLMQFTGQHDKNGKEIYEGDILRTVIPEAGGGWDVYIDTVIFIDGAFVAQSVDNPDVVYLGDIDKQYTEIIGNIFENSDLISGKETGEG